MFHCTSPAPTSAPQDARIAWRTPAAEATRGPLLIVPDTSALLAMLGARSAAQATPFTLDWLSGLAAAGRLACGRDSEPRDRVAVVVTDSVMKQLEGLKLRSKDDGRTERGGASRPLHTTTAIRRFFSKGNEGVEGTAKLGGWPTW